MFLSVVTTSSHYKRKVLSNFELKMLVKKCESKMLVKKFE